MKQKIIPILDNGHGFDTAGKRSPIWADGSQMYEYEFNRNIVKRICEKLDKDKIKYKVLVPELRDVSLRERCLREHKLFDEHKGQTILFSIHANAGGGTGWECYTSKGNTKADKIATIMCQEAEALIGKHSPDGFKLRTDLSDGDPDKEAGFYILKHSKSPAVLSENLFMDTEQDFRFINSERGRELIAQIHYLTIKSILKQ